MVIAFEAHVTFEVPEGTKPDELAEILDYIKEAVDKWRYMRPKGRGPEGQSPWKMSNVDVPSFSVDDSCVRHSGQPLSVRSLRVEVEAALAGPVDYKGPAPTLSVGNNAVVPAKKIDVLVQYPGDGGKDGWVSRRFCLDHLVNKSGGWELEHVGCGGVVATGICGRCGSAPDREKVLLNKFGGSEPGVIAHVLTVRCPTCGHEFSAARVGGEVTTVCCPKCGQTGRPNVNKPGGSDVRRLRSRKGRSANVQKTKRKPRTKSTGRGFARCVNGHRWAVELKSFTFGVRAAPPKCPECNEHYQVDARANRPTTEADFQ